MNYKETIAYMESLTKKYEDDKAGLLYNHWTLSKNSYRDGCVARWVKCHINVIHSKEDRDSSFLSFLVNNPNSIYSVY